MMVTVTVGGTIEAGYTALQTYKVLCHVSVMVVMEDGTRQEDVALELAISYEEDWPAYPSRGTNAVVSGFPVVELKVLEQFEQMNAKDDRVPAGVTCEAKPPESLQDPQ